MKIAILSFTRNGSLLGRSLEEKLKKKGHCVIRKIKCKGLETEPEFAKDVLECSAKEWTGERFKDQEILIFIGAVQIAVRLIAPYIESKTKDPAVLVFDEKGRYCIPILSGHIGGANEIAERLGQLTKATPVITTATDMNRKWAVDVFAKKNHLYIEDMQKAKEISAAILEGREIKVAVEGGQHSIEGTVPEDIRIVPEDAEDSDIYIGIKQRDCQKECLRLIPQVVSAGIGCKRGTGEEKIQNLVEKVLRAQHMNPRCIGKVASIDLKKEEEGLLAFCRRYQIEPEFYPAEALREVQGEFSASSFVRSVTGVDNVCERSAVRAGGTLRIRKQAEDGVTAAFAWDDWRVKFE